MGVRPSKSERIERRRQELMMAIDYLERLQNREYGWAKYEERAQVIKDLNRQLKELSK